MLATSWQWLKVNKKLRVSAGIRGRSHRDWLESLLTRSDTSRHERVTFQFFSSMFLSLTNDVLVLVGIPSTGPNPHKPSTRAAGLISFIFRWLDERFGQHNGTYGAESSALLWARTLCIFWDVYFFRSCPIWQLGPWWIMLFNHPWRCCNNTPQYFYIVTVAIDLEFIESFQPLSMMRTEVPCVDALLPCCRRYFIIEIFGETDSTSLGIQVIRVLNLMFVVTEKSQVEGCIQSLYLTWEA